MDRATFDQMHGLDKMASEELAEGIKGFTKALIALEKLLAERLAHLEDEATVNRAAKDIFQVYDLDGDGFITREEWAGTDTVFESLDMNGDGKLSPEEIAAGVRSSLSFGRGWLRSLHS